MKKLLGSTLALAMFLPAGANAELLKNFKATGSLEVSAVSANNVTDFNSSTYDGINSAQTRIMLHADWDLLDDVHSRVSVTKNDRGYGSTSGSHFWPGSSVRSQTALDVLSYAWIDEAYVKIDKLFAGIDATLGRQFYGEAGDLVIYFGPKALQYSLPVTALDAARFDWNAEKFGITALAAKIQGQTGANSQTFGAATDTGDVGLTGLDLHGKPWDILTGSIALYRRSIVKSGPNVIGNDLLYVLALKAKATLGGGWVKADFAQDFGQNRLVTGAPATYTFTGNYTGWATKVNLGYKGEVNRVGVVTGWAEAGAGSGGNAVNSPNRAFVAIAGDYRPGGIYGRFAPTSTGSAAANPATLANGTFTVGSNTLSNRVIYGLGFKVTPAPLSKLTAGLSWWNTRVQSADSLPVGARGNKFLGNEYDLDVNWQHSENVSVSAGLGTYQPGRAIIVSNGAAGVSPATLAYTDFSIKF